MNADQPQGSRQLPSELIDICCLVESLRAYPHQLSLLLQFIPSAVAAVAAPNSSPSLADFQILRIPQHQQQQGSNNNNPPEVLQRYNLNDVAESIRRASFEQVMSVALLTTKQDVPLAAKADYVRTTLGIEWEPIAAVFHLLFLKDLLSNLLGVQLLFRIIPEGPVSQQHQTLEQFQKLLTAMAPAAVEAVRKEVSLVPQELDDQRQTRLETLMSLRPEYFHLYRPFLALLAMSADEAQIVRKELAMMTSAHLFKVVQLRMLTGLDVFELQSLLLRKDLASQHRLQQQQQQQQQMDAITVKTEPINSGNGEQMGVIPRDMFSGCSESLGQQIPQQRLQPIPIQQQTQMVDDKEEVVSSARPMAMTVKEEERATNIASGAPHLEIIEQPPERCVYKRNVKPGPTLIVAGGEPSELSSLTVVPLLFRCDQNTDESKSLSGNTPIEVTPSRIVVFRRLKILVTSHQLSETLFVLRFELRKQLGPNGEYQVLDTLNSNPITVVSHSTQLRTATAAAAAAAAAQALMTAGEIDELEANVAFPSSELPLPTPPPQTTAMTTQCTVIEVVPCTGPVTGGTRVAILGSNFVNSPSLRVQFDNMEVVPQFYGPGTLICHTPMHSAGVISVRVCNAPNIWSDSAATYTFTVQALSPQQSQFTSPTTTLPQQQSFPQQQQPFQSSTNGPAQASPLQYKTEMICRPVVGGNVDVLRRLLLNNNNAGTKAAEDEKQEEEEEEEDSVAEAVDQLDARGFAALHYAATASSGAMSEALIDVLADAGADMDVSDQWGNTPLHWAAATGNEAAINRLLARTADARAQNLLGETPLHTAASTTWHTSANCIALLCRNGAEVNIADCYGGETALHKAAAANSPVNVRALVFFGAHVNATDDEGNTPLHSAAGTGARSVIRPLITAGAEINVRNQDEETPLQVAALLGYPGMVDFLVGVGADVGIVPSPSPNNLARSSTTSAMARSSSPSLSTSATRRSYTRQQEAKRKILANSSTVPSSEPAPMVIF